MTKPISTAVTPNLLVLKQMRVEYEPYWDGTTWTVEPTAVIVRGKGFVAKDDTIIEDREAFRVPLDELPPSVKSGVTALLNYLETELVNQIETRGT